MADRIDRMIDTGKVMRLRLGVLPLFGSQRLFPRLGELRKLHPQLHIDIDSSTAAETKLGDTIDAAIILSEGPDAALHSVRLDHNRVYAIASKQLAAELGNRPDMAKLARQTFLVHNDLPASFEAWKRTLHLEALEPAAIDHFDSGQLILEAAAQGLGIAIMHDDHFSRSHDPRLARVYDIEVDSPYSYWFVPPPRAAIAPGAAVSRLDAESRALVRTGRAGPRVKPGATKTSIFLHACVTPDLIRGPPPASRPTPPTSCRSR
jgi:LysR family glycine cleavage system transcriptional activator